MRTFLETIENQIPQESEKLNATQQDFLNIILKMMETNDNELKRSIRKRRKEQKKLEKRIETVERDYMVKPTVFLKQIQKDINEKVSETFKKMKEKLSKTFNIEKNMEPKS